MSQREFQTEVSQLLHLIVHSLYSHPEIFLRELISNSSDALDKLRYLTLTDDAYRTIPFDPRIELELDEEQKTLTISDTGIGMNEQDLISNLGTIARSGTKSFVSQLSGDAKSPTTTLITPAALRAVPSSMKRASEAKSRARAARSSVARTTAPSS